MRPSTAPAGLTWQRQVRADLARLCALIWLLAAVSAPLWALRAQAMAAQEGTLTGICRGNPEQAPADGRGAPAHHHDSGCCLPTFRHLALIALPAGPGIVPSPATSLAAHPAWAPAAQAPPPASPARHPQAARAPPTLT